MEKKRRAVIHIDMDAFFVSVELKRRGELRGKPVIVGGDGDPHSRGVVSSASYEARRFGIHSGMPLKRAKRLCPKAVFLPVDYALYEEESEKFMNILREYTDLVESFGLDEAFLELRCTPEEDPFEKSIATARKIKERIKKELSLTATVGIAPNKLLAKLATELSKPDGFMVIREEDVEEVLKDLPVRKLWGVGEKTEKRLKFLGIHRVGQLSRTPLLHLIRYFGKAHGTMLHEYSRGIDESPVVPFHEPNSMSREVTFEQDTKDVYFIKEVLYELTKDVAQRLREEGYRAKTFTIKIRYWNFKTITRSRTVTTPTDSLNDMWTVITELIDRVDTSQPIRLVGVKASGLEKRGESGLQEGFNYG